MTYAMRHHRHSRPTKIIILGVGIIGTCIDYNRLEKGIAHYDSEQKLFDTAGEAAALMRRYGVSRRLAPCLKCY